MMGHKHSTRSSGKYRLVPRDRAHSQDLRDFGGMASESIHRMFCPRCHEPLHAYADGCARCGLSFWIEARFAHRVARREQAGTLG
jgi:predicted amidophosphoribosyltransferase